jgi:putative transposase
MIRADTVRHSANAGKVERVLGFTRRYRACGAAIAAREWRAFFEAGAFSGKYGNVSAFNAYCGAAPAQMARAQVMAMLGSFLANRQNDFRDAVTRSSLASEIKHALHTINRRQAWFDRHDVTIKGQTAPIPAEIRRLARCIMRGVLRRHRRPNARGIAPVLDTRSVTVAPAASARHSDLWASFKLVGQPVFSIPLHTHAHWRTRQGKRCNVLQVVPDASGTGFSVRLMTDMAEAFAESRAAYLPRTERIGVDFGLATLMATDRGDLLGRGFLDAMRRLDGQLVAIARHRMRSGGKPRESERYRGLVDRVRGIVKTRINTALNRIVSLHAPAEIVVERLDFRMPGLSRRLNRIITNCGRAVFKSKLADLKDKFGIEAVEINPAYTSQECSRCGYVARENRLSQSRFRCVHCGHTAHADVDGAKVITARRSRGLDFRFTHRRHVLAELQRRFGERPRRHHHDVPRGTKASSRQPIPLGQSQPGRTEMRLSHESQ